MGPKKPDQRPMLASTSQQTHSRDVDAVGSASARSTGRVGTAHAVAPWWARISSAYQSNERFGVRTRVS